QLQRYSPLFFRPLDALGPQRIGGAHQIDQVPAAVAALPLTRIRVEEVAIEAIARHLVIEAQAVVARTTGPRCRERGMHAGHELALVQALLQQTLRVDAGYQTGSRVRKDVVAGPTVDVQRLADLVQRLVGADPRHLQRTITTRIDTGGLVVVPEGAGSRSEERRVR